MIIEIQSEEHMIEFGYQIGGLLEGGDVLDLIGDVGAGKTKLTKGIAIGLGVTDEVQSPSFTICRNYSCRDGLTMAHYDFYRLSDAGIMADEISEAIENKQSVIVIEWADAVANVLPDDRLTIKIFPLSDDTRKVEISADGQRSGEILSRINHDLAD